MSHFIHSQVTRLAMRDASTYHSNTLAAPTKRAVGSLGRLSATYTASGTVVPIATRRPTRDARRWMRRVHATHSPPIAIPGVISPQPLHGWLGPTGHGARKLDGRSIPAQVPGADVVRDYGGLNGAPQPRADVRLPDVVQHHRGAQHQGRGVRDPLPRDVGRRTVDGLEDRRVHADVGAGRESQPPDEPRREVREDVAEQVRR